MIEAKSVTAAVVLIGDEVLSGRTRDANLQAIAQFLAPLGVSIAECRTVSDEADRIIAAVNALRAENDYVFTTGGIGPTHDDITAESVGAAFGVQTGIRGDALEIIEEWYARTGTPLTESRKRMARIPDGASLIDNPVTGAPGFQIGNVFVLAGVPKIARGMLEDIAHRIEGGAVTRSRSVRADNLREGDIAEPLGVMQEEHPAVSIGSYPYFQDVDGGGFKRGTHLVARATDAAELDQVIEKISSLVSGLGFETQIDPET